MLQIISMIADELPSPVELMVLLADMVPNVRIRQYVSSPETIPPSQLRLGEDREANLSQISDF